MPWGTVISLSGAGSAAPIPTDYISSGDSWQTLINAAGAGAVIGMNAGTYPGFAVSPLANQKFVAVGTVILDGNGAAEAFSGHGAQRGVEIWGENLLRVTDYGGTGDYHGVICTLNGDWYGAPTNLAGGWKVDGLQVDNGGYAGVVLDGQDASLTNFLIYSMAEIGFKIQTGDDCYIGQGEVHTITPTNWGHEGGGSKCWNTNRLTFEDIYVHGIVGGPGLWTDMDNNDTIYRRITMDTVGRNMIFHEISGPALIEDCVLTGDGSTDSLEVWSHNNVGIKIANSGNNALGGAMSGVTIRNNDLSNLYVGIAYLDQIRDDQWSNDRTDTTEGEVYGNTLDNCDHSGDQMDHAPSAYVYGALPVDWTSNGGNTLLNGSVIH